MCLFLLHSTKLWSGPITYMDNCPCPEKQSSCPGTSAHPPRRAAFRCLTAWRILASKHGFPNHESLDFPAEQNSVRDNSWSIVSRRLYRATYEWNKRSSLEEGFGVSRGMHATRAPDALSAPTAFTTRDLSARSPQISQELRLWCYTANPQEGPFQDSGA